MHVSTFDLFSIGIGPSSSHTVGPMRAASRFVDELTEVVELTKVKKVFAIAYGSLAWTGHGHATDKAILLGLSGQKPEMIIPEVMTRILEQVENKNILTLADQVELVFEPERHLLFNKKELLPKHNNGLKFVAYSADNSVLLEQIYYSVGGGFVLRDDEFEKSADKQKLGDATSVAYPFLSANALLEQCRKHQLTIPELMIENEKNWRSLEETVIGLMNIWQVMHQSIINGCEHEGVLPGKLQVRRRAPAMYRKILQKHAENTALDMNWLSVFAIAVNEENAAGGRVVTAPTNGAAGIIPSVLNFALKFYSDDETKTVCDFLLTASAVGLLYKENASISAAEVGCQGEVGVACSMAAAGFAAIMGGTLEQIENAAEIAMEHHLGLTCDPIAGLVQIPCIERNAMGSVQAVNAARMALLEDGQNKVSLDDVIKTMRQTGQDMLAKYKETAQGGLAVNVPDC